MLLVYQSQVVAGGHPQVLKHSEKWGVGNGLVKVSGSSSLMLILVFNHTAKCNFPLLADKATA